MSREEALTAVCNIAAAMKREGWLPVRDDSYAAVVSRRQLEALFGALDALDAVGDGAPAAALCGQWCDLTCFCHTEDAAPVPSGSHTSGEQGRCQADPSCFRTADLPSGTCYHHSPMATAERVRDVEPPPHGQAPLPWERARRRDGVFTGGQDGD